MLSSEFIICTWQLQTKCVECALPQVHDTFKLSRFITCDQAVTKMKLLKVCTYLLVCTKCDNKPNQKSFCLHILSQNTQCGGNRAYKGVLHIQSSEANETLKDLQVSACLDELQNLPRGAGQISRIKKNINKKYLC